MNQELFQELSLYLKRSHHKPQARLKSCNNFCLANVVEEEGLDDYIRTKKTKSTFSYTLLKLIDSKGISDADAYKASAIDRKLFSKIRINEDYHPSKNVVFAFIIGLELNMKEANNLLKSAGYSFSDSETIDLIIQFFITKRIYDCEIIDEALVQFNQKTLFSKE